MPLLLRLTIAVLAVAAAGMGTALADYPDRPVRIVVTYPPGGGMDVMARLIANPLSEKLRQPVVVENRPGASGMIGGEYVAKSPPDGYTLIIAPADTHSINPHIYKDIRYDVQRGFAPVAFLARSTFALIVNPSVKAKTVPEFLKLVADQPGKLSFASWGVGSSSHVLMEILLADKGLKMLHVPFTGAAPAVNAVIAGDVNSMMISLPNAEAYHSAGRVRIIGTTPTERAVGTQTYSQEGMPSHVVVWIGVLAPAKTPAAIVDKLNRELLAVIADPQMETSLVKLGFEPSKQAWNPTQFGKFLDQQYEAWGKTIKEANITAELK